MLWRNREGIPISWLAAGAFLGLIGCGPPQAPDLRARMTEATARLGVQPVYPLTETLRIGAIYLVDYGAVGGGAGRLAPQHEPSILLTEHLVEEFDEELRQRYALRRRLPQSPAKFVEARGAGATGQPSYVQSAPTGNVPSEALPLSAMPGYTLASVDQAQMGGFLPNAIASLFGALGLRNTTYLRMEAEAVEVAELPLDRVQGLLARACLRDEFRARGEPAVAEAFNILVAQRRGVGGVPDAHLALVRRVFYLRGIRFIIHDTRATAALAQAAVTPSPMAPGASAPTLAQVTVNTTAPGTPAPTPGSAAAAANAAAIDALTKLSDLRDQLARHGNIQIALSAARATATGVELVQLFDRPLAFGFQALLVRPAEDQTRPVRSDTLTGYDALCERVAPKDATRNPRII
jgi:hypothetical protein